MPFFSFEGILECGLKTHLEGFEARHAIKSRRLRPGEVFEIQDSHPERFQAKVIEIKGDHLDFVVEKRLDFPHESTLNLELWLAAPKQKALEWVLQKGTELGVSRITIFKSRFCSGSMQFKDFEQASLRWERICGEACKQSGRISAPVLNVCCSLEDAISRNPLKGSGWLLSTESSSNSTGFSMCSDITNQRLLVGPEGGWHQEEESLAVKLGMKPVYLGPRIMRTETAVISALAILQYLYGDMCGLLNENV